ncbi:MAG: hypothetical protein ABH833_01305 [Parcubacteria group bacterium]
MSDIKLNISDLNNFLYKLGILRNNNYLSETFSKILISFIDNKYDYVCDYLRAKISNTQICREFISYLDDSNKTYSYDKISKSLDYVGSNIDLAIKKFISKPFHSNIVNLFGYGLADGHYEETIAAYLVSYKYCDQVCIYGYDPYYHSNEIRYINIKPEDISNDNLPKFDIIITRWTLHHVNGNERWDAFLKFINHIKPNGHILIIEECLDSQEGLNNNRKTYELIQALEDAFVNYIMLPGWCCSSAYHIEYLKEYDFAAIEKALKFKFTKYKWRLNKDTSTQTIIHYNVI